MAVTAALFPRLADPLSLVRPRTQGRAKRGRGKAVTWPSEDKICQVRFFLVDDLPSSLGPAQEATHLPTFNVSSDEALDVPPGFHGTSAKRARINYGQEVTMAIERPWCRPQEFLSDSEWWVANGGESKEVTAQQQREVRILEAFYPRLTSVPDSPAEPMESFNHLDDLLVPQIPSCAIEEDCTEVESEVKPQEDMGVAKSDAHEHTKPTNVEKAGLLGIATPPVIDAVKYGHGQPISKADPKIAAAAAAACMAVHQLGANGLVDRKLLLEILQNPTLLKNFTVLNQSWKDPAMPMNGNDVATVMNGNGVATVGQSMHHNVGLLHKVVHGSPTSVGLPSPVSVLSEWTEENGPRSSSRMPSNISEITNAPNFANVSMCTTASLSSTHAYSHRAEPGESMHAWTQENNTRSPCVNFCNTHSGNAFSPSTIVTPQAHVTSNGCSTGQPLKLSVSGSIQSMQAPNMSAPSQFGTLHSHTPMDVGSVCPFPDARSRNLQNESTGVYFTTKAGHRSRRLCIYFNTPRGCRNGGSCAFVHQQMNSEMNGLAQ